MRLLLASIIVASVITLTIAADAPCPRSFSPLESHLTDLFRTFGLKFFGSGYHCVCSAVDDSTTDIACTLFYDVDGSGTEFVNVETATLHRTRDGEFVPAITAWSDEAFASWPGPEETFQFDINGNVDSCEATQCDSCEICLDGISIAINCTSGDPFLSVICEDQISGAFMNTFNFNEDLVWRTQETVAIDYFCNLSSQVLQLEAHMANEFAIYNRPTPVEPTAFQCECTTPPESSAAAITMITCRAGESDSNGEIIAMAQSADGTWTPASVAWYSSVYPSFPQPQETFFYQDGTLVSCEAAGCASCDVCEDGIHVAIDCSSLGAESGYTFTCQDRYSGAFASSFDFSGITSSVVTTDAPADATMDPSLSIETLIPTSEPLIQSTAAPADATETPNGGEPDDSIPVPTAASDDVTTPAQSPSSDAFGQLVTSLSFLAAFTALLSW